MFIDRYRYLFIDSFSTHKIFYNMYIYAHTHTHVYTPLLLSLSSHPSNWINWIFPGLHSGSLHIHKHFFQERKGSISIPCNLLDGSALQKVFKLLEQTSDYHMQVQITEQYLDSVPVCPIC